MTQVLELLDKNFNFDKNAEERGLESLLVGEHKYLEGGALKTPWSQKLLCL